MKITTQKDGFFKGCETKMIFDHVSIEYILFIYII